MSNDKKIVVECKACEEVISARRGDYLVRKQQGHIQDCHPGFEELHNDYKED